MLENEHDKENLDCLFCKAFFNMWETVEAQ